MRAAESTMTEPEAQRCIGIEQLMELFMAPHAERVTGQTSQRQRTPSPREGDPSLGKPAQSQPRRNPLREAEKRQVARSRRPPGKPSQRQHRWNNLTVLL